MAVVETPTQVTNKPIPTRAMNGVAGLPKYIRIGFNRMARAAVDIENTLSPIIALVKGPEYTILGLCFNDGVVEKCRLKCKCHDGLVGAKV